MEPVAFTLRNDKLLPCLITPCKVSQAYDSSSNTPRPISIEVKGLWDTGASCTVITKEAANKLGIQPITQSITYHAQGESLVNIYFIN
ncbi:MAG: aspartyl protease family protein, partial [Saccharofermentanales bacterium]